MRELPVPVAEVVGVKGCSDVGPLYMVCCWAVVYRLRAADHALLVRPVQVSFLALSLYLPLSVT
jgi:hypothetical protein